MNHDYETGVALLDSVNKTWMKRPLRKKSRWRHIRLAIKPRYLGYHAPQIKSYDGSISGSHGRSFRIRHEKSHEAPPRGEITMTSYPACNKTSLSRKTCIPIKSYYGTLSWSHARSFRIRHEKVCAVPPGGGLTMTSYPFDNKPRYLGNHASQIKRLLNTFMKSWSLSTLQKTANINFFKLISL